MNWNSCVPKIIGEGSRDCIFTSSVPDLLFSLLSTIGWWAFQNPWFVIMQRANCVFFFHFWKSTTSTWGTCPHPVLCFCFHWQMFQRLLGSAIAPVFLCFLEVRCRNSELKCKTPEAWEAVFCQWIEQSVTCLISYVKQLELWHY